MRLPRLTRYLSGLDLSLLLALLLAFCSSLYGIQWGRVEGWNRDQMALRDLRGILPLDYQKPPLHTYLNHLLILAPISAVEWIEGAFAGKEIRLNEARLVGSRLLVVALFLGAICCAYLFSRDAFGVIAARIVAFTFASSSGFIVYNHFLSCDSPLLFFLVLTLLLSYRAGCTGRLSWYLLAGLSTGLSTATKYNGLAVGLSLVVAHLFATPRGGIFDRRLLAGLAMAPVGFALGNPGILLDFPKFVADFTYNSKVTPHYDGTLSGHGYLQFFERVPEIVGWPGAIVLLSAVILSAILILRKREWRSRHVLGFALAASVFSFYFAVIGSFPRMENRFVLPAVPFLILMAGPFLATLGTRSKWFYNVLLLVLLYNCVCSWLVGYRFTRDPRLKAQTWVIRHARLGLILESSAESPHWTKLPRVGGLESAAANPLPARSPSGELIDWRMPYAYGRTQLFRRIFPHDLWLQQHIADYEIEADETLFTRAQLRARNPNFVLIYSTDYHVPSEAIRRYYGELLSGRLPYDIAFDAGTKTPPWWSYPQEIDFLSGRLTILKRRPASVSGEL